MENLQLKQTLTQLREQLKQYQYEYYVLARPSVSDNEYDRLFDRLLELEQQHPELAAPDSPSQRVGSDLSQDFPFVRHKIPVLSLDKCYTLEEILAWLTKIKRNATGSVSFVVEEKIDGASIVLYYEKGVLTHAVTRGNGSVGNDITGNVKTIGAVPLRLPEPVTLAVRGEIFLPKSRFARINSQQSVPYANPRNLASGSLRRIKSAEVARIPLDIFVYEGFFEPSPAEAEHIAILEHLQALGFKLNRRNGYFAETTPAQNPLFQTASLAELADFIAGEQQQRQSLDYEIDGLVIKVNEIRERESLGYTGHHPRWAIAYKFESPAGITEIEDIKIQVGRSGRITPVALVKPVEISGSVISRVTLHNQDYINILELGVGDRIVVEKRGDVIPSAASVVEHSEQPAWRMPAQCPACDSLLVIKGAHHFCPNPRCPDVVKGRIQFFTAKSQMDLENLGQETVAFLVENNLIQDIDDLYTFEPDVLLNFPGFGEKKIQLIKEGIAASKNRPYRTVLASLGIPDLGPRVAELLIEAGIRSLAELLQLADTGNTARLVEIPGIGEKMAATILTELREPALRRRLTNLQRAGLQFTAEEEPQPTLPEQRVFADQVWCVTGSFEHFKPREKAMELVKKYGGRVVTGITGKTTHLLAGSEAGSKLTKAEALGVKIVLEGEFMGLIQECDK